MIIKTNRGSVVYTTYPYDLPNSVKTSSIRGEFVRNVYRDNSTLYDIILNNFSNNFQNMNASNKISTVAYYIIKFFILLINIPVLLSYKDLEKRKGTKFKCYIRMDGRV